MNIKVFFIYYLSISFFSYGSLAFAEYSPKEKENVDKRVIEKTMPAYKFSLRQLVIKSEKNLEKINEKLAKEEQFKRSLELEALAKEHFEKGNELYEEGKFKEAREEWKKVLKITNDPVMKDFIKKTRRKK